MSRVEHGALCASVKGGQNVIMSWPTASDPPQPINLSPSTTYRLSFRAFMTGPLAVRIVAKVGHRDAPYTPVVQAPVAAEAAPHLFAVDFEPHHADPEAGVAFVLSAPRGDAQNEVCIDDVSVAGGGHE
jgi:hypothetical protein